MLATFIWVALHCKFVWVALACQRKLRSDKNMSSTVGVPRHAQVPQLIRTDSGNLHLDRLELQNLCG